MSALGATTDQPSTLVTGTSQLQISAPAPPRELQIPFVQIFGPKTKFTLNYDSGKISTITSSFETVTFVSLSFAVEITGQNGRLQFAATTSDKPPSSDVDWLGAHVHHRFAGNAHGDTFAEWSFPREHRFGTELKAIALGNDPPKFYFRFLGGEGDSCTIAGRLVLRGGGYGIIPPIQLETLNAGKSSASSTRDSAVSGV